MSLFKVAKTISWLSCGWVLMWNLYGVLHFGPTKGVLILFCIIGIHAFVMLTEKYLISFRIAAGELFITIFSLFVALYPPIPWDGHTIPLLPFNVAIWVWLFGASTLTIAAWVCLTAANDINHRSKPSQHNSQRNNPWKEYFRPWKLVTFACGLGMLIAGALYYKSSDWNVGISVIMGTLSYISAPWVFYVVKSRHWRRLPEAFFVYWFTVDGSYVIYNAYWGYAIGPNLRLANFFASSLLYLLCGWLWSPQMSFREFLSEISKAVNIRISRQE